MLGYLKGGIGGIVHPPIGRKDTTYSPCRTWGVKNATDPTFEGNQNLRIFQPTPGRSPRPPNQQFIKKDFLSFGAGFFFWMPGVCETSGYGLGFSYIPAALVEHLFPSILQKVYYLEMLMDFTSTVGCSRPSEAPNGFLRPWLSF